MFNKIVSNYERGKSKRIKFFALIIKTITGIMGASMILTEQHPYLTLFVLCLGAAANETLNFIKDEEHQEKHPGI